MVQVRATWAKKALPSLTIINVTYLDFPMFPMLYKKCECRILFCSLMTCMCTFSRVPPEICDVLQEDS